VMVLVGVTHFAAMLWLIVARHEIDNDETGTWYQSWVMDEASQYEVYFDSVFWATATMTSIGYGDIYPLTDVERAFSLLIMIVGATTYGALFGTLAVIIDSMTEVERENRTLLSTTKQWAKRKGLP
jgi:hypothetical protein